MQEPSLLSIPVFAIGAILLSASSTGCQEKPKYTPEPAYSGTKATLPKPPTIPTPATFKDGTNWTVYGLQHQLNHPRHRSEVDGKSTSIVGYVVAVNRPVEPAGKTGCIYPTKAHPPTAKEPTPKGVQCDAAVNYEPPHFFIADSKDEKNKTKMVTVMGYASSYIQQYMARDWYKTGGHKIDGKDEDKYLDNNYSAMITSLGEPKIGSKVVVSGTFGRHYEEGQGGRRVVPAGIIDVTSHKKGKIEYKDGGEEIPELK